MPPNERKWLPFADLLDLLFFKVFKMCENTTPISLSLNVMIVIIFTLVFLAWSGMSIILEYRWKIYELDPQGSKCAWKRGSIAVCPLCRGEFISVNSLCFWYVVSELWSHVCCWWTLWSASKRRGRKLPYDFLSHLVTFNTYCPFWSFAVFAT